MSLLFLLAAKSFYNSNQQTFFYIGLWNNKCIQPLRFKMGHFFGVKLLGGLEKMGRDRFFFFF